jgi:beta-1,4-mannosyltransferase
MKNREYYIFPFYSKQRNLSGNTYLKQFTDSFASTSKINDKFGRYGVISLFFNLQSQVFIFHWLESISKKKQAFALFVGFVFLRLLNKKIIWVLHNKRPHKEDSHLGEFCMGVAARFSNYIVCHSKEGFLFVKDTYGERIAKKVSYIPHPVYHTQIHKSEEYKWDIIVWGNILPYKNILEFVKFIKKTSEMHNLNILICGNCKDEEYAKEIENNLTSNITFIKGFIKEEELKKYICQSKAILFTYKLDSVLSSGSLIYSLNFNKLIIGPDGGAFKDLGEIVICYENFSDLQEIDYSREVCSNDIKLYLAKNTWELLPNKINSLLE